MPPPWRGLCYVYKPVLVPLPLPLAHCTPSSLYSYHNADKVSTAALTWPFRLLSHSALSIKLGHVRSWCDDVPPPLPPPPPPLLPSVAYAMSVCACPSTLWRIPNLELWLFHWVEINWNSRFRHFQTKSANRNGKCNSLLLSAVLLTQTQPQSHLL